MFFTLALALCFDPALALAFFAFAVAFGSELAFGRRLHPLLIEHRGRARLAGMFGTGATWRADQA